LTAVLLGALPFFGGTPADGLLLSHGRGRNRYRQLQNL
jgi:hypothetical protein